MVPIEDQIDASIIEDVIEIGACRVAADGGEAAATIRAAVVCEQGTNSLNLHDVRPGPAPHGGPQVIRELGVDPLVVPALTVVHPFRSALAGRPIANQAS